MIVTLKHNGKKIECSDEEFSWKETLQLIKQGKIMIKSRDDYSAFCLKMVNDCILYNAASNEFEKEDDAGWLDDFNLDVDSRWAKKYKYRIVK